MAYGSVILVKEAWSLSLSVSVEEAWPMGLLILVKEVWSLWLSISVKEAWPLCLNFSERVVVSVHCLVIKLWLL